MQCNANTKDEERKKETYWKSVAFNGKQKISSWSECSLFHSTDGMLWVSLNGGKFKHYLGIFANWKSHRLKKKYAFMKLNEKQKQKQRRRLKHTQIVNKLESARYTNGWFLWLYCWYLAEYRIFQYTKTNKWSKHTGIITPLKVDRLVRYTEVAITSSLWNGL